MKLNYSVAQRVIEGLICLMVLTITYATVIYISFEYLRGRDITDQNYHIGFTALCLALYSGAVYLILPKNQKDAPALTSASGNVRTAISLSNDKVSAEFVRWDMTGFELDDYPPKSTTHMSPVTVGQAPEFQGNIFMIPEWVVVDGKYMYVFKCTAPIVKGQVNYGLLFNEILFHNVVYTFHHRLDEVELANLQATAGKQASPDSDELTDNPDDTTA